MSVGLDARAWRPATLRFLTSALVYRQRNELAGYTDRDHLEAAAAWLARAHDATSDGGIAGRYMLGTGWASSYPETTGYIVPTFLALEQEAGLQGFRERARRCIEFLLDVQLPSGAFPGMEIAENRERPSIFNSAQILNGLTAWHKATSDDTTLEAAHRAASWLVEVQDPDGAWRRHLYGSGRTYSYMAHAGCWLAEFGAYVGDKRYLSAASSHLDWVLGHVDESTGWIADCGFGDEDQNAKRGVTHTIAYTIWGTLLLSQLLGHERGLAVARRAANAVHRRLELSHWLPGKLDSSWKGVADYACLTGNAQMALIWLELNRLDSDPALVSAACKALDLVKRAQSMSSADLGLRGGVGGSDPIWGGYVPLAIPNWPAKFFVDGLLAKARALRELASTAHAAYGARIALPSGVPTSLPTDRPASTRRPRVVMLADESSTTLAKFSDAWSSWGFRPDAVVLRRRTEPGLAHRIRNFVRDYGMLNLARRFIGPRARTEATGARPALPVQISAAEYCAKHDIPTVTVASLDGTDLERIRALNADLFIYAGCGILRQPLLALPKLGTLNAHMGLLPAMRGMNVTEWSVLCGAPTGCTVHLIDGGIDTGDVLIFAPIDTTAATSVQNLRDRVDSAQVELLGRVVEWVRRHDVLPPRLPQVSSDGRQYFVMHADVRAILEKELAARTPPLLEVASGDESFAAAAG